MRCMITCLFARWNFFLRIQFSYLSAPPSSHSTLSMAWCLPSALHFWSSKIEMGAKRTFQRFSDLINWIIMISFHLLFNNARTLNCVHQTTTEPNCQGKYILNCQNCFWYVSYVIFKCETRNKKVEKNFQSTAWMMVDASAFFPE